MRNKRRMAIAVVLISVIGLSLLLYPAISDYINSTTRLRAITAYSEGFANLNPDECDRLIWEAWEYNESLVSRTRKYHLDEDQAAKYPDMLKTSDSEVMGYIEIPKINCFLPICYGTDKVGSELAADHVEWSSLPVGGASSHCVISEQRGMPSSKLFTDLNQLEIGDVFLIRVLDLILTYEVDQILVVESSDVSALTIEPGKDYCSLMVNVPFGLNPHRVMVRGLRSVNTEETNSVHTTSGTIQFAPPIFVMLIALLILVLLIVMVVKKQKSWERRV